MSHFHKKGVSIHNDGGYGFSRGTGNGQQQQSGWYGQQQQSGWYGQQQQSGWYGQQQQSGNWNGRQQSGKGKGKDKGKGNEEEPVQQQREVIKEIDSLCYTEIITSLLDLSNGDPTPLRFRQWILQALADKGINFARLCAILGAYVDDKIHIQNNGFYSTITVRHHYKRDDLSDGISQFFGDAAVVNHIPTTDTICYCIQHMMYSSKGAALDKAVYNELAEAVGVWKGRENPRDFCICDDYGERAEETNDDKGECAENGDE